jgi:sulfite reductase (ferredoxin)
LGGTTNQTRLAEVFAEKVKLRDLESTLEPLLYYYKGARMPGEAFGDFTARVGFAALRQYAKNYVPMDAIKVGSATVS